MLKIVYKFISFKTKVISEHLVGKICYSRSHLATLRHNTQNNPKSILEVFSRRHLKSLTCFNFKRVTETKKTQILSTPMIL